VLRETLLELLVQPDWDQLGGVGQWQALVAAWIDGRPWQVELAEAAIPRLCQEKAEDAQRCERAALLGQGLVALAPLAAEAERRQMAVIRGWDAVGTERCGAAAQVEDPRARVACRQAWERQVAERKQYLARFGKRSEWYGKWAGDRGLAEQVQTTIRRFHIEVALFGHALAQMLKADGQFEEAFAKYGEAGLAYEDLLKADPESPDAYRIAWTLAECWYWAGVQCTAPLDKSGNLIELEGEVAPTPVERVPALHNSCESMRKAIGWYRRVRDWRGERGKGEDGKGLDFAEKAAWSALDANERLMSARASLPKGDPQYLEALALPQIRASQAVDDADMKAAEGMKEFTRVKPKPLPPAAVEWLLEADAYVELAATHTSLDDPARAAKVMLKAAELLYKYRHFDPWPAGASKRTPAEFWSARLRFRRIFERFPGTVRATEAVSWLLTAFALERDMSGLEEFTSEIERRKLLPEARHTPKRRIRSACRIRYCPADALYVQAAGVESAALQLSDPAARAAGLVEAKGIYIQSGDANARCANEADLLTEMGTALVGAANAYGHAQAWEKCLAAIDLGERVLRQALNKPKLTKQEPLRTIRLANRRPEDGRQSAVAIARQRRELTESLRDLLEMHASVQFKFFRVDDTFSDFVVLYDLADQGGIAAHYLGVAARLSAALGNLPQAVALTQRLIRDFANDSKQAKRVQDAAANLATLHRQAKDPTAELAALTAFTTRYKADKSASGRVFRSLARTAELQTDLGQAAAATATRKRIVATFAARALPRDAAPEAMVAAQATLDLLQPQVQTFLATKPDPTQLPKLQADLASLVTATQAVDSYDAPLVHASAAALRSRLRRHVALQARATAPELAARLQAESVTDLTNLLKTQPASTELRQELHYYQPDLTPPAGPGLVADFDPPGTLPLAIELPAPASDSAVAAPFNQALTHYRAGQNERAIAAALRAVQLEPAHSRSKVLLSTLQLRSGDPTGALATVDAGLTARPTDVMLLAQKVLALAALGRTPEALQVAQAALRMDHSNPELQRVVGDAYRLAGRDGLAELAYDIARSTYLDDLPKSDESALPVKQYDDRKLRSYGTLQGVDAEALPRDAGLAHLTAATARLVLWKPLRPDLHATRDDLESALKLRQDAAELHADLGAVLLALGDRAALPTLHRALELRQGDARLLNNLALAQRISGQAQQARATLDQAHRADPQLPAPLYNLALLRLDALRDGSDLAEIRKLLTQFKQLRGPMPAGQPDPADALLAEAEALLAWRLAFPPS
jgi:Flp pilus assembly protein TadD